MNDKTEAEALLLTIDIFINRSLSQFYGIELTTNEKEPEQKKNTEEKVK
jgi:hypothetical protein